MTHDGRYGQLPPTRKASNDIDDIFS